MTALQRAGAFVTHLTGWKRVFFAFAAGAFSALGFAPVQFFPALLVGFALLVLLIDGAVLPTQESSASPVRAKPADGGGARSNLSRLRRAVGGFKAGWAFAFGQYLIGLHWIGYAFLVDPAAHLWQMPFALVFLAAGLALWAGLAMGMAACFWRGGAGRLFLFAAFYAAGEWLRGHAFTGFPWNLPAYGWGASLAVLQSTSVVGAYGLSLLTILLGAALAELPARRLAAPAAMVLLFVCLWGAGAARLAGHPTAMVAGVQLRLVQPDVPQREKYQRRFLLRNWQRLLDLSAKPGAPSLLIWPEAAPPFVLNLAPTALDEIALLTQHGRGLFAGAQRAQAGPGGTAFYNYNSLYMFAPGGRLVAVYDKFHLVPFGEYVPFAGLLGRLGISKLTQGEAGFAAGDGPHTYQFPGLPAVGPLICYEIIFPGAVTDPHARPQWLVNVTDDSWFGPWAGPHQHLLIARVRAIEEGLPVVRAANTGISAVIDPLGRLTASLGLGKMGVLDAKLPKALAPSTYARFGDAGFFLLLAAAALLGGLLGRKREI